MISCTEFIPAYSELFAYLEEHYGRAEVDRYWRWKFTPDGKGIPLTNFLQREGIRGCFTYWAGTLNEEAADFTMYLNEKRGFFYEVMHRCPSKGRLLELEKELGLRPYPDYCLHCDCYRYAVEKAGLRYIYNFQGMDKAACSMLIYDPAVFDGRVIIDGDTRIMDRRAADNPYFHRDFHSSMNQGMEYLGSNYGKAVAEDYLRRFTRNVYGSRIAQIRETGLDAVEALLRDTYRAEQAEDALTLNRTENALQVTVHWCPAVRHLQATGRTVSQWFDLTTRTVMETLAQESGLGFSMDAYDPETGAAQYQFVAF